MASPKGTGFRDLDDISQEFSSCTKVPETFLGAAPKLAQRFRQLTKRIYDYTQSKTPEDNQGPLTELIIDDFDNEQIWQEIELQNDACISQMIRNVSKLVTTKEGVTLLSVEESEGEDECEEMEEEEEVMDEEEDDDDDDDDDELDEEEYDASQDLFPELGKQDRLSQLLDSETEDLDLDVLMGKSKPKPRSKPPPPKGNLKRKGPSVVDDKFFKLADMEMFLEAEDAKEERQRRREDNPDESGSDDDDEEDVDMFEDIPSEDDDEEEDEEENDDVLFSLQEGKDARNMKYSDFFDAPEDSVRKEKKSKTRKVQFDVEEEEDDDVDDDNAMMEEDAENWGDDGGDDANEASYDDSDDDGDLGKIEGVEKRSGNRLTRDLFAASDSEGEDVSDIIGGNKKQKSTFEKRQEKLQEKINQLQEANLAEKPWQLMGETSAAKRPDNSLLEEHVEFDHTIRPAPVITDETTHTLEDIIKQRIKDEAWDDVVRKHKPKEEAFEYRKRVTLDQEKSKMSLGEIYEREYLKQAKQLNEEEENKEHTEIKKMMDSLFLKLDALSNFHYTPKPAIPEIKIVSNMPSITMEEVAPIGVSDANVLAPEEVKEKPRGEILGDSEKTATDRKRERRKKKKNQHIRKKDKEKRLKLVEKINPGLGNKYSKKAALAKLEKQSKFDGKTTVIKDDRRGEKKTLSSSKAFFTKLQDEVSSEIKQIKTKKKKKEKTISSAKLKL